MRSEDFPENVRVTLANARLRAHLKKVIPSVRDKRHELLLGAGRAEYEQLRAQGRAIREESVRNLDRYLAEFSAQVTAAGGQVVPVADAEAANRYVVDLAKRHGVTSAVKAKSMTTEETRLNEALAEAGVDPVETDLGQIINQLAGDEPFHMVAPAIHHSRADVADLFARTLKAERTEDLTGLARIARAHLRQKFCAAGMGISGVNFAVAETGTVVICENEGNIGLSTTMPRLHVVVMGVEKVIPRLSDLSVMLPLLARAGGLPLMFRYVSMLTGTRGPGGPEALYVLLLDNGRRKMARDPVMHEALRCIRCGACQAACPVYDQVGGHAYGSIYQGPIGAMVSTQLQSLAPAHYLPHASTLCGACVDVCPVEIPIPHLLLELRHRSVAARHPGLGERLGILLWALLMSNLFLYRIASAIGRAIGRRFGSRRPPAFLPLVSAWSKERALPPIKGGSFRQRWKRRG
jgi:L-lactate dehydrogenase complex protein LldF